jgi:hypothetical protein
MTMRPRRRLVAVLIVAVVSAVAVAAVVLVRTDSGGRALTPSDGLLTESDLPG